MRFGPFVLDERTWTLTREGATLDLSPRLVEILAFLAARAGDIVTKDELLDRFWPDVHVTENTLARAIADIRKGLGDHAAAPTFLQTASRRGYRFIGTVSPDPSVVGVPVALSPRGTLPSGRDDVFAQWVEGRLALESLDATKLDSATQAFERAVEELPHYAPAHAGLANARLLQLEAERAGGLPDPTRLMHAVESARTATSLDAGLGEAWAVLGHLLLLAGRSGDAQAAARRATVLEPDSWRHQYRLALSTWGEERLRAIDRALALLPGCGPAHLLSAMVFVARGALDRAERDVELGVDRLRVQGAQARLPAAGLYWMRGLIAWARGRRQLALESLEEERRIGASGGHVYAREIGVNTGVATGFLHLASGDLDAASAAFSSVLALASDQPRALLGLAFTARTTDVARATALESQLRDRIDALEAAGQAGETALLRAGHAALSGESALAMDLLHHLLNEAQPGRTGWMIPVDPMLATLRDDPSWPALLGVLAGRAA